MKEIPPIEQIGLLARATSKNQRCCKHKAKPLPTCRVEEGVTYIQEYNVENRMSGVKIVSGTCATPGTATEEWRFKYRCNGKSRKNELLK